MVPGFSNGQTDASSKVGLGDAGNYKHGKKHGLGEIYKNGELVSRATYHEGQIVEEKKSNSRFLKIDTELFNDSKSMNLSSKFSRTSKGSEFFDFNG